MNGQPGRVTLYCEQRAEFDVEFYLRPCLSIEGVDASLPLKGKCFRMPGCNAEASIIIAEALRFNAAIKTARFPSVEALRVSKTFIFTRLTSLNAHFTHYVVSPRCAETVFMHMTVLTQRRDY